MVYIETIGYVDVWVEPGPACAIRTSSGGGSVVSTSADTVDLNGDGIPDYVKFNDTGDWGWQVWFGLGRP